MHRGQAVKRIGVIAIGGLGIGLDIAATAGPAHAAGRQGARFGAQAKSVLLADDERQIGVVLDLHSPDGVVAMLLSVASDGQDFAAGIIQRRPGLHDMVDGPKTRHLFSRRDVDGGDAGTGIGATQNLRVQHAGAVDVKGVSGAASGFFGTVEPLDFRAENPAILWPRHVENPLGAGECQKHQSSRHTPCAVCALNGTRSVPTTLTQPRF